MNNKQLWVVVLILLVSIVGYIGYDEYTEYRLEKDQQIALEVYQYANQQIVIEIFNIAVRCESIPITSNNQTVNLIAIECMPQEVLEYLQQGVQNG